MKFYYTVVVLFALSFGAGFNARASDANVGVASGLCRTGTSLAQGTVQYKPFTIPFIYYSNNPGNFAFNCIYFFYHGCVQSTHVDLGANPKESDQFYPGDAYFNKHERTVYGPILYDDGVFNKYKNMQNVLEPITDVLLSAMIKDVMCYPGPPIDQTTYRLDDLRHPNAYRPLSVEDAQRINPKTQIKKPMTPQPSPIIIHIPVNGLPVMIPITPGTPTGNFVQEVSRIFKVASPIVVAAIIAVLIGCGLGVLVGAVGAPETGGASLLLSAASLKTAGVAIIAICAAWNIQVNKEALKPSGGPRASLEKIQSVPSEMNINGKLFHVVESQDQLLRYDLTSSDDEVAVCTTVEFETNGESATATKSCR